MKLKNKQVSQNVVVYQAKSGVLEFKTDSNFDTIYLTQNQVADVFGVQKSAISKHAKNIFESKELDKGSTVSILETVQKEGGRLVTRKTEYYNLDLVLSIGYRVNSKQATSFRRWATQTLKSYLVTGYALNEKRLITIQDKWNDLKSTIELVQNKIQAPVLKSHSDEVMSLLNVYASALTHLFQYDQNSLQEPSGKKTKFKIKYNDCLPLIENLKIQLIKSGEAKDLFGRERAEGFSSILENIYQTFGGVELYPSLEGKAAHLFYFVIKDHPFSDGNKRIASFMLIYFLKKTHSLYDKNGDVKINPQALTALALLVAESDPAEKNIMIKLIMNLVA